MKASVALAKLVIDGGRPVRSTPFAPWPAFAHDEIEAAASVLASGRVNYWTGEHGRAFEREFAASVGAKHAVAVANGSVALELALHALGIGPGGEVIVPSRSFIASAGCVLMRGARPVFADVDRNSGNLTAETIRPLLSPRTRAIIAVHLGGWPCEMGPILDLIREHNKKFAGAAGLRAGPAAERPDSSPSEKAGERFVPQAHLIEDCAQAQAATLHSKPVGSFGDAAAFSFCQDKIMTTGGEGGMLLMSDEYVFKRAWSYKDHGKNFDLANSGEHSSQFRWLHEGPGTNWRMTEMQSAMGRTMLPKISERITLRQRNAAMLDAAFAQIPALRVVQPPAGVSPAYYRYYVYLRPEKLARGWDRDRVQVAIEAEGIPCFLGSCSEIYLEKTFPAELRPKERLPVAQELGETSLAFLVHSTLSEQDMHDTAAAVDKVMQQAS